MLAVQTVAGSTVSCYCHYLSNKNSFACTGVKTAVNFLFNEQCNIKSSVVTIIIILL